MRGLEAPVVLVEHILVHERILVVLLGLEAVEAHSDVGFEFLTGCVPDRYCVSLAVDALRSHWRGLGW